MRYFLNGLYKVSLALAACCLVAIAALVVLQVLGRLIDGVLGAIGLAPVGLVVPSLAEIAGFLLVGASFLALAGTLRNGDHIRVTILLQWAGNGAGRLLNLWSLFVAFCLAAFFSWHAFWLAYDSYLFGEVSFGIIAIPLVYPQAVMMFGLLVFAVSLFDDLLATLSGGRASFETVSKDTEIEGTE